MFLQGFWSANGSSAKGEVHYLWSVWTDSNREGWQYYKLIDWNIMISFRGFVIVFWPVCTCTEIRTNTVHYVYENCGKPKLPQLLPFFAVNWKQITIMNNDYFVQSVLKTLLDSITAMMFSLKAWPIVLLKGCNISDIACHLYKCVADRHRFVSNTAFSGGGYRAD